MMKVAFEISYSSTLIWPLATPSRNQRDKKPTPEVSESRRREKVSEM